MNRDFRDLSALPKRIFPITLLDRGVMRAGMSVYRGEKQIGWITSGTMVPYYCHEGEGLQTVILEESGQARDRACLSCPVTLWRTILWRWTFVVGG